MPSPTDESFEEDRPRLPRPKAARARERRREDQDDRNNAEEGEDRPRRRRRRERDYDDDDDGDDEGLSTLIPYKNGKALAAYYCGVFALIPCVGLVLGPLALVFGILGYRFVRDHPKAHGTGHAIAGIVLGSLVLLVHLAVIALIAAAAIANKHQ